MPKLPMIVNSKLTHDKIRQISIENKRLKNRQSKRRLFTITQENG